MKPIPERSCAFTLIELLVTIGIMVILASLLLSGLALAKEQARRIKCISNLKQIALAAKEFATDHDGRHPWHTQVTDGGTYGPNASAAWRNFSALSNDLTPQVLVCPSDTATKKMAGAWPEFMTAAFQKNAVSYFVGLDGYEQLPVAIIAGDRNIAGGPSDKCGSVASSPGVSAREYKAGNANIRWTNAIHGLSGDLAFADGSVQRANRKELQETVNVAYQMLSSGSTVLTSSGKKPSNHLLLPR